MHDQADNLTQTRSSIDQSPSLWFRFRSFLCPCLVSSPDRTTTIVYQKQDILSISQASGTNQSSYVYNKNKSTMPVSNNMALRRSGAHPRKRSQEIGELQYNRREALLNKNTSKNQKEFRETLNIEMGERRNFYIQQKQCIVGSLVQNQLLSIGVGDRHVLAKVKTAIINANLSLLKRDIQVSRKNRQQLQQTVLGQEQLNKYWNQRYILFQKFDEGIDIDDSSWAHIPPEQISDYIANKCAGAKKILNGFAGVGGTAIKLASMNSNAKVIANDYNGKRAKILLKNAKVYEVDGSIELNEQDFLKIEKKDVDVVYVQPPVNKLQLAQHHTLSIVDFEPTLDHIIIKALKLAQNFMMLLPPETNIELICSCLNKCAFQLKKMKDFCSILIEKIYFQNQFLYILVSMGKLVQTEIKLNDELNYIYTKLRNNEQKYFRHKKIIKKIRQDRGMLELFNLLKESEKRLKEKQSKSTSTDKNQYLVDCFYDIIRQKQYLAAQKLQKIIEEQNTYYQKKLVQMDLQKLQGRQRANLQDISMSTVMEQQKAIQSDVFNRRSEPTESEPSNHYSYYQALDKSSSGNSQLFCKMGARIQSHNFNSEIIKRTMHGSKQKRDVSPKVRNNSPSSPHRYGKNRVTQIFQKRQNEMKGTKIPIKGTLMKQQI